MKYKELHGNANCPKRYVTPDRYKLGIWQNSQRREYKKGKLSDDRIEKLEGTGFKWKLPHPKSAEYYKWKDGITKPKSQEK